MPVIVAPDQVIDYLKRFLAYNKARGMVAELALDSEIGINNSSSQQKLLPGGWILSPKIEDFHYHRYMVSVLPSLYIDIVELKQSVATLELDRGWQALATFLSRSGIGIIVSGACSDAEKHSLVISFGNIIFIVMNDYCPQVVIIRLHYGREHGDVHLKEMIGSLMSYVGLKIFNLNS